MKRYETRQETVERERLVEMRCDLCGRTTTGGDWTVGMYDVADTRVEMRTGKSYPEGGETTTVSVDVCPTCFRDKLIPWLRAQGADITTTEAEW